LVVLALLLALSVRPDDGTPVTAAPADAAALVSGAHHAKPLPHVHEIDSATTFVVVLPLIVAIVLAGTALIERRRRDDAAPARPAPWATTPARRGPPAFV
jgi:hypothetical protein